MGSALLRFEAVQSRLKYYLMLLSLSVSSIDACFPQLCTRAEVSIRASKRIACAKQ
jgi:hypothetical protein